MGSRTERKRCAARLGSSLGGLEHRSEALFLVDGVAIYPALGAPYPGGLATLPGPGSSQSMAGLPNSAGSSLSLSTS